MTLFKLQKKLVFIVDSNRIYSSSIPVVLTIFLVLAMHIAAYPFNSVVIYPFQNQLTDKKLYWLPRGFAQTIANSIDCPDDYILKSDDVSDLYEQIGLAPNMELTYATLIKMCQLNNIQYALFGTMKNADNNIKIDAKIFIAKTSTSVPIAIEGNLNNILALQNQIVKAIVDFLNAHGIKAFQQNDVFKDISPYSFEMYIKAQQEEKNETKIKFLKQALKEDKSFSSANIALAQVSYEMEDYENAIQHLANIPSTSSLYPKALFYVANIHALKNDYSNALTSYLEASKYQRSSSLFNNIAAILIRQDDLEHAQWYMEQALSIIPADNDLIFNHAILSLQSKEYKKAKEYLISYLNKHPENLPGYLMLEFLSRKENNESSASIILDIAHNYKDFAGAKEKFSDDIKKYLIYQYNLEEELLTKYEIARNKSIDDNNAAALRSYKERAKENMKYKEYKQSLDDLFKASLKSPFDWELYYLIGKIYYLTNDIKNAEKYLAFSLWCKENPESSQLLSEMKSNPAKP